MRSNSIAAGKEDCLGVLSSGYFQTEIGDCCQACSSAGGYIADIFYAFLLLPLSSFTSTTQAILLLNAHLGIFSAKQETNRYKGSVSRVRGLTAP